MSARPRHPLYRALLRLAPAPLRDRHADEMETLFAERLDEARPGGWPAVARAWLFGAADLLHARAAAWTRPNTPLTVGIDERNAFMIGSDFRYALRSLARQKSASALVICMLSLGIAANVAVFSLVNGLFLRPFPFPHPDRLVYINETAPKWNLDVVGINYPDFARWREDMRLFESIAHFSIDSFNLSDGNGAERIRGAFVTWDFPRVLGVAPILGRTFSADEDKPKGPPVVVIGEALWQERFGGDPSIVGRTLRLDGASRTIVGVMPSSASFPDDVRLWVPMAADPNRPYLSYNGDAIGRLKPGVTAADADRDLKRAHQPIWDKSDKDHIVSPFVKPLREQFVHDYRTAASTVTGAVAVLLLIACANVAAVMLARALARRREMGIRLALGSSRLRLMRQLLVENLVLAAIGGVIGLVAGQWAIGALLRMIPDELPRWAAFQMDARVMFFSLAVVVVTVVLFGWAPALHAVGGDVRSAVHASTNASTGAPRGRRTLWLLVCGEFALAAMLLVCGTLLVKAFDRVRHVDPGFRADHVLTFSVPISEGTRPKPEQWVAFWDQLLDRTRRIAGVDAAGLVTCPPLGCHMGNFFTAEGAKPMPDGKDPVVLTRLATPGYFEAMGIRLQEGRFLRESDERDKQSKVVIVDETFARTFWGEGVAAVGRRIKTRGKDSPWFTVVGVAGDVRHYGLERPMRPGLYFPQSFDPTANMTMAVHTRVDPESIIPAVRQALREIDPELPLVGARTMEENLRRSLALRAAFSWMLAVFAFLAFVLAIGGAYGVATYLVTQRTREIGIRVALGARTGDILKTVVGHGLSVVAAGVTCGIVASLVVTRLLTDALFGVSPADVTVLTFVASVLVGTALMANGLPARRAARIDPMRSLRTE
jgi:putative ABC transport system permease protein